MNINWKIRLKNPVWWAQVAAAVLLPMLAAASLRREDMTAWPTLWGVLTGAFKSPVTVVSVAVSLWNALIDPTTKGLSDSSRALSYETLGGVSAAQSHE